MKLPLPAIALISLLATSAFVSAAAPVVTAFSVSPAAVDISTGDATVQVTVHITDDDVGLQYANMSLYSPSNGYAGNYSFNQNDVEPGGSPTDGTYLIDVVIPQYGAEGNWRLEIDVTDSNGSRREYGDDPNSGELPFPVPGNELIDTTNSGTIDTVAPQLASISISPSTVDVSSQDQVITVTLNITDDYSGLNYGYSSLEPPSGPDPNIFAGFNGSEAVGTRQDGIYTFDMTLPRGSVAGIWTIRNQISDLVGNFNFPESTFTVVNNGGAATGGLGDACDATQYNWTTWSTSGNEDWFFQTATTHDGIDAAQSGPIGDSESSEMEVTVTGPGTLSFWWKVDSEPDFDELSVYASGSGDSDVISGDSGWTQVFLNIDSGPQTVTWTYSKDGSESAGEDAGWVDQVYFAADSDNELPTLQYIDISPDPASIAGGQVDVTVTFEVSDDYDGVYGGYVRIYDPYFAYSYNDIYWDSNDLQSQNEGLGTYQVTFTIYQSDFYPSGPFETGTWRAEVDIEDEFNSVLRTYGENDDAFPNPGDELFSVTGSGSSGQLGILSIDSFTPDPVDITSSSQIVTIDFTIDDPFQEFSYGYIYLHGSTNQYIDSFFFDSSEGSGNQYSVDLTVPNYAAGGTWSVEFSLYDQSNNETYIGGSIQTPGDDEFTVINNGIVDSDPPVLTAISITPATIDTSGAPQVLSITASVSDNLAGMDYAYIEFYDPTGTEVDSLFKFVSANQIVGGSFTATQTLPQGSDPGLWRCEVAVRDIVGNFRKYGTGVSETPFPVPADAEFTVGTGSGPTYSGFTDSYSLFGTDALPSANPDSDWANNAMEFLLGLNPTVATAPDPSLYQMTRVGNELHLDFKVAPGLTVTTNGIFLDLTNGGSTPPFKVTGQIAPSVAGPWLDIPPLPQGGGIYRVTLPIGPGGVGFCRLRFLDP